MKIKLFTTLLLTLSLVWARLPEPVQSNAPSLVAQNQSENVHSASSRNHSRVDTTTIWIDDMEADVSGWTVGAGWVLTETSYSSPTHSFNFDDDNMNQIVSLISPVITLPEVTSENEFIHFSFDLWCDMPDADGDGDNYLEDYYWVDVANLDDVPTYFHQSTDNAYSGNSWWCADPGIGGYNDAWLQFLDTPTLTIPADGGSMTAQMKWSIEDPAGASVAGTCTNGWDAANVRISSDGGTTWNILNGDDAYDFTNGYGWIYNDQDYYDCQPLAAGWGGVAAWHLVTFDLSAYANQSVIIRFGFGSDPSYSTGDDATITGLRIDDISVVDGSSNVLFTDNADDEVGMLPVNGFDYQWDQVFYDYGDVTRPGGVGWATYMPGDPFNTGANTELDLTPLAGSNIKFRFTARTDDNHDGGNGGGLFIDDLHVWSVLLEESIPVVQNVTALAGDAQVTVSWDNPSSNFEGLVTYDDDSFENAINMNSGTAIMGTLFDAPFGVESVTVNSALVFGAAQAGSTTLYGYENTITGPAAVPLYSTTITTTTNQWVEVPVNWTFTGDFVLAIEISSTIGIPLDESTTPSTQSWANLGGWATWADVAAANSLPDGEWGIRANVTSTGGSAATYNVYRSTDGGPFNIMFNGQNLTVTEYVDHLVVNGSEYCYQITVKVGDLEGNPSDPVCAVPEAQTIYALAYDDGNSNTSFNVTNGNTLAVRFTPLRYPSTLTRVKYYIDGSVSGIALAQVWDDDGAGNLPGTVLLNGVVVQLYPGWNEKNVTTYGITINSGDFYVGWTETSQTPPIGVDTDSPSDRSVVNVGSGWEPFSNYFDGAIMIRADMDSAGSVGVSDELTPDVPASFGLAQNYPNPFNPVTNIEFDLAEPSLTKLVVYDLAGREVQSLVNRSLGAGHYRYQLNGSMLSSGMYIYRIEAQSAVTGQIFTQTRKLVLMK